MSDVPTFVAGDPFPPGAFPATPRAIGKYAIREEVGRGGMGVVYRAWDPGLKRDVAIKVLPGLTAIASNVLARFYREAEAIARLTHPNIVTIYDLGHHDEVPYLVMEFVAGHSLAELLEHQPSCGLEVRLAVLSDVCEALHYAHSCGVIHRDLKPANIRVTPARRAKLLDFGLALLVDGSTTSPLLIGTPAYMAPEVLSGQTADHRSDLFSLGATAYEWLSGRRAFTGSTVATIQRNVLNETPSPLARLVPEIAPELARVITRMLDKSPAARPGSAADVGREVEVARQRLRDQNAVAPVGPTFVPRALALTLIALILGGVIGALSLWPVTPTPADTPRVIARPDIALPAPRERQAPAQPAAPLQRPTPQANPRTESPGVLLTAPAVLEPPNVAPAADALPIGTDLIVRLREPVPADTRSAGRQFVGELVEALARNGREVAAAGTPVTTLVNAVLPRDGPPQFADLTLINLGSPSSRFTVRTTVVRIAAGTAARHQSSAFPVGDRLRFRLAEPLRLHEFTQSTTKE